METVTVQAHATLQGLRAGEVGTIERNAEVDALIEAGRLTVVDESAPEPEPAAEPKATKPKGTKSAEADPPEA